MIKEEPWSTGDNDFGELDYYEEIADFIMSDRKRIVEPLVNNQHRWGFSDSVNAIKETLKRAGVTDEK